MAISTGGTIASAPAALMNEKLMLKSEVNEATTMGMVCEAGVCVNTRTGRPIRALAIMHVFGHPADVDGLAEVAARWNLVLVEDAAEALGSFWNGRHLGGFGRLAALSFNGNKIVTEEQRLRPEASEVERLWADSSLMRSLTGWTPEYGEGEGFRRGLRETIDWFSEPANLARYKTDRYIL